MLESFIPEIRCTRCGGEMRLLEPRQQIGGEIVAGTLECRSAAHRFPIEHGVPNVLREPMSGEKTSHFGHQWTWYLSGKFENPNESTYGEDRAFILQDFWEMTGLTPETLRGKRILDAGS